SGAPARLPRRPGRPGPRASPGSGSRGRRCGSTGGACASSRAGTPAATCPAAGCGWRRPRRAERGGAGRPWRPACVPAWWLSLPSSPWWSSPAWPPWRTLRTSWSGRSCWVSGGAWRSWGDLVVAAAEELEQAPAVPERVGQPCDAPPRGFAHLAFGAGAGSEGAGQGRVQVIDHDIQMEWGPVSVVVAPRITGGDGAGRLAQQV